MLIWIAVTAALLLVGCGTEHAAPTTTSAIPTTSAAPTTTTVSPREWAQPSLQYSEKVAALFPALEADFNELGRSLDLRSLKSTAAEVENGARNWRIARQAAGPPPDEIAVELGALFVLVASPTLPFTAGLAVRRRSARHRRQLTTPAVGFGDLLALLADPNLTLTANA